MNHITSLLPTQDIIFPSENFRKKAHISSQEQYEKLWEQSIKDPDNFWEEQAKKFLVWEKTFTKVRSDETWHTKWFEDGLINASVNALDKHLKTHPEKIAIKWEGEPGDKRELTYSELHKEVCKLANGLKSLGVKKGDIVTIYMPMVPELAMALLACSRIGAMHSVVFAGFSGEAIAGRIQDADSKIVLTADGIYRKGQKLDLKTKVDEAAALCPQVKKVLVLTRTRQAISWNDKRDVHWEDLISDQSSDCSPEACSAEDPLFLLYTSGSTGKPKGIQHATAGYLLQAALSFHYLFDLKSEDLFWCTADIGWITGHTYMVYGPLSQGASILMYEGALQIPNWGRAWKMIEDYKVSIFYTAPTAIRSFMQQGEHWPKKYNLSSLRLLGSVGEPINPTAWHWYRQHIGQSQCPIIDTWWQTETGSTMISTLPGAIGSKAGSAGRPFFGILPEIVDQEGNKTQANQGGYLVIRKPWPGMFRTIWKDHQRYVSQYFQAIPDCYMTGDGARQDEHGYFWIMGRIDDVLNVAGHRLSTMEIESALVAHPHVAEAAVVGIPDDLKGEAIICFVVLKQGNEESRITQELSDHIVHQIGALARPQEIKMLPQLPKTRSGKIMRRLLRSIACGKPIEGDTSTLE